MTRAALLLSALSAVPALSALAAAEVPAAAVRSAPPPASIARVARVAGECATCGKSIRFGERCLVCITAEWKQARSHPCATCEKPILVGPRCAACAYAAARARLAHPCAACQTEILFAARCGACSAVYLQDSLRGVYDRGADLAPEIRARLGALLPAGDPGATPEARAEQAQERAAVEERALERYAASAAAWTKRAGVALGAELEEHEAGRRAAQAVGAAVEVAQAVETTKREIAYRGIRRAGRLPVHSELGWTTLGELAHFELVRRAPALAGTDLAEDPAAVLAALVVADHLHFLMDLKLVATPDGPVSIVEALERGSGADPGIVVACVTALEAVQKLRRGEDLTRSVRDLSRAIELLNPELSPDEAELSEEPPAGEDPESD